MPRTANSFLIDSKKIKKVLKPTGNKEQTKIITVFREKLLFKEGNRPGVPESSGGDILQ
jgi:hypothetical protein